MKVPSSAMITRLQKLVHQQEGIGNSAYKLAIILCKCNQLCNYVNRPSNFFIKLMNVLEFECAAIGSYGLNNFINLTWMRPDLTWCCNGTTQLNVTSELRILFVVGTFWLKTDFKNQILCLLIFTWFAIKTLHSTHSSPTGKASIKHFRVAAA